MLKRQYPFVVGWEYANPPSEYGSTIYVNLEIDLQKSIEYFGMNLRKGYEKYIEKAIEDRETFAYPFSTLEYTEDFESYQVNTQLDFLFQKYSKIQNSLNILEDSQFNMNKKIKFLSTESHITNYAITCIFLNNKMLKYKIPNQILFEWVYSCDKKIKLAKPVHYTYNEIIKLLTPPTVHFIHYGFIHNFIFSL
jgi:hypothetical protein